MEFQTKLTQKFAERFVPASPPDRVLGRIFPNNKSELTELIQLANQHKAKLHVVSTGKNWGFSNDEAFADEPYYIVYLKNLNRILKFDEKLAYVVLEPGVTYEQLYQYLQSHSKKPLLIDAPGSSMRSSVIGNLLERGHGQTPYSDHIGSACNFEILLGSGQTLRTGFGAFQKNKLQHLDKWGVGPSIEGLFSQSNFGIVLEATVWLMPRPENISLLQLGFSSEKLPLVVDALTQLRLQKYLLAGPHFANVYFLLSRLFTLQELTPKSHLSYQEAVEIGKKHGLSEWSANLVLYGTDESVHAVHEMVREQLGHGVDSMKLSVDENLSPQAPGAPLTDSQRFMDQISGRLGGTGISRLGWRHPIDRTKSIYDLDMESSGVGVICTPLACPADGEDLLKVHQILNQTCARFETEPFTAAFVARDRLVHVHNFLIFDQHSNAQVEKHQKCAAEINRQLAAAGYLPHRLTTSMCLSDYGLQSSYEDLLETLKKTLDPNRVLIDQRYSTKKKAA